MREKYFFEVKVWYISDITGRKLCVEPQTEFATEGKGLLNIVARLRTLYPDPQFRVAVPVALPSIEHERNFKWEAVK